MSIKKKLSLKNLLFVFVLIFSCFSYKVDAAGNIYYVSPSGVDTNAGSSTAPFKTIQKAANVVNAGDTVIVKDGTYTSTNAFLASFSRSGTASNYITFKSENKWGAVITPKNLGQSSGYDSEGFVFTGTASYINIEDFEIKNGSFGAIYAQKGSNHLNFRGNNIHDIGRICSTTDYGFTGINLIQATNILVENNIIHDIGRYEPGENGCNNGTSLNYKNHDHGLYVNGVTDLIARNNIFYNIKRGQGVHFYSGDGFISSNINIINNTFAFGNPYHPAGHIMLWGSVNNSTIANNIFYSQVGSGMQIYQGSYDYSNDTIKNNITYGGTGKLNDGTATGITISGNLNATDPKFTNPTSYDFTLLSSSPAINAGLTLGTVTNDFNLVSRPQGTSYDIGAYEYSSFVTPITTYSLSITKTGAGNGTVTGAGTYNSGTVVTSIAVASSDSTFTGWSGDCNTTGQVTMTGNKTCTATFTLNAVNTSDTISPVVSFSIGYTSSALTIPIDIFTATDNVGVSGYLLTESSVSPSSNTVGWSNTPQQSYTFTSSGFKTLYAWAKDGAGNISKLFSDTITIALPISKYSINYSAGVGGSISGNLSQIVNSGSNGTAVVAVPETGYSFISWSDGITTSSRVETSVTSNKSVIATFAAIIPITYSINSNAINGIITFSPDKDLYNSGDIVSLTAVPLSGYVFNSWAGDISGSSSSITITMNSNKNVIANFSAVTSGGGTGGGGGGGTTINNYNLSASSVNGIITKSPDKISYTTGDIVSVMAQPLAGYSFYSWGGDTDGTMNPKNITMDSDKSITASFIALNSNILQLTKTLRYGSRSSEVKILQTILKNKGYFNGTIDGVFGRMTYYSVKAFQRANGLKADGVVGVGTRVLLNK